MSDIKLIKPKFRKSPRQKRKEKQDKIGAGIIGGSILAGGAALYKTAKDKIEKDYGRREPKKKRTGGLMSDRMQKEIDKIVAKEKLAESLSKRNPGRMYKSPSFGYTRKKAEKENRKLTQKEKRRLERDNARTVIDEESKADYSFIGKPMRKRTIREMTSQQPEENASYLNLKNASASQGSFQTGGLLIEPKFKKTSKNRKKDQFKEDHPASMLSLLAFPAGAPAMYGIGKTRDYLDKKKREPKKASPEIKAEGAKKGKMIKAKSGKLADAMKKLREKAYEKSGKKYKGVGKFGKDEYLIQKPLPGMKKGKMIKLRGGGAAIRGTKFKGVF